MGSSKILLIIPAFNESGSILKVIHDVNSLDMDVDILVIDDASTDDTVPLVRQAGVSVISLDLNLGIGGAVQVGFQYAQENGYATIVRLDADGQHDAVYINELLKPIRDQDADMVIGSRFLSLRGEFQSSPLRRMGIFFFARIIGFLTQYTITDPTSGFCAWNDKCIHVFAEYYPVDFPEPESLVIAKKSNLKVLEVPVIMHERTSGASSISNLKSIYYMLKVTCAVLLGILKRGRGHEC